MIKPVDPLSNKDEGTDSEVRIIIGKLRAVYVQIGTDEKCRYR